MRYFKNSQTQKLYAIPKDQEFLIHSDWVELAFADYEKMMAESKMNEGLFDLELSPENMAKIQQRLIEIDEESIRPLRAIATNTDELLDHKKLALLNDERSHLLYALKQFEKIQT